MPKPTPRPTNRVERPADPKPTLLSPIMFAALGSSGVDNLRQGRDRLLAKYGCVPDHIVFRGIDSTPQSRNDDAPMLPPESFFNLADEPQLQERLRHARQDPETARWMPELVTRLSLGNGMGGLEPGTRFCFEQQSKRIAGWTHRLVDRFTTGKLPATAERAGRNPVLRAANAAVSDAGPLRVLYFVSATGGTSGAMFNDVFFLRDILRQLGIDATFTLFLTPPALAPARSVESIRKARKLYARFQEMVDLVNGKLFEWNVGTLNIREYGFPFEAAYILPEPRRGEMPAHHRKVGDLVALLTTPQGKELADQSVNQVDLFQERGPRGQKKFLSLLNISTVHPAAFADPVGFARAGIAAGLGGPPATGVEIDARALLTELGLNDLADVKSVTPPRPTLPDGVNDVGPYLRHVGQSARAEAEELAKKQLAKMAGVIANANTRIGANVHARTRTAGPAAALPFARAVEKLLAASCRAVESAQAQCAHAGGAGNAATTDEQLRAVWAREVWAVRTEYLGGLRRRVQALRDAVGHLPHLEAAVDAIQKVVIEGEQRQLDFDLTKPKEHAFLDRPALEEMATAAGAACRQQVWAVAAEQLRAGAFDPEKFDAGVRELVARAAQPMARFSDINEAMRAAGGRADGVLASAARAAEPDMRVSAGWQRGDHSARFLISSFPETHPAVAATAGQVRQVCGSSPLGPPEFLTLLAVDFGVEPAALDATSEALEAAMHSTSEISPHPDMRYEPFADVMVPPEREWLAYLAIPLHLVMHTGTLGWDERRAWTYNGHPLGATRLAASECLRARAGRPAFLPSFEQFTAEVEELLAGVGDGTEVVRLLATLDEKVTLEMAAANPGARLVLMLERAAIRAKGAEQRKRNREHEGHGQIYGSNGRVNLGDRIGRNGTAHAGGTP